MRHSIGVDIGATKILAGLVREDGCVVERLRCATPDTDAGDVVDAVVEVLRALCDRVREHGVQAEGVGIGTAGQIDVQTGTVLSGTPNIRNWQNVKLCDMLAAEFALPVWVDNDVNVHLLAEARLGVAKACRNAVMLALGTGVGGAALVDGQLLHGQWGGAAEFGHMSINFTGPACNCGSRGCLELYASGPGIAARMRSRAALHGRSLGDISSMDVFVQAEQGDETARETIDELIEALCTACVNLIHGFNPSVLILGGGVMEDRHWIVQEVANRIRHRGMKSLLHSVAFKAPAFGAEAGLVGAALQVFTE